MGRKSVAVELKQHEQRNKGKSEHVCLCCDEAKLAGVSRIRLEEKFILSKVNQNDIIGT